MSQPNNSYQTPAIVTTDLGGSQSAQTTSPVLLGPGLGAKLSPAPSQYTQTTMRQVDSHSTSKMNEKTSSPSAAPAAIPHKTSAMGKLKGMFRKKQEVEGEDDDDDEAPTGVAHIDPALDNTDPTPFLQKPSALAALVDPKSLATLEAMGGIDGVIHGLGTDAINGLSNLPIPAGAEVEAGGPRGQSGNAAEKRLGAQYNATLADRERVYGRNFVPPKKPKTLFQLMWAAMKDKVLIILGIAAVVSLALGIYQSVGVEPHRAPGPGCPPEGCAEPQVEWVEGVAILVAVTLVVMVGSVNDYQKELQFKKLNEKKDDRSCNVIRGGKKIVINTKDLVVGDICVLEPGEVVPVDGIFLRGHDVRCDESGATGESDLIRKFPYEDCIAERDNLGPGGKAKKDCFLLSGAKVTEGVGEYVVISVGTTSFNGRLMMSLRTEGEITPLQTKLNRLAELIATFGASAGGLLFFCLMIRFFVQLKSMPNRTADEKGQSFIQILIIAVTLVVVAVPEGLPLAVTLALAFATKRMTKENLLVRVLASCETMASTSVICTDKTGTLTTNNMAVVSASFVDRQVVRDMAEHPRRIHSTAGDDVSAEEARNAEPLRPAFDLASLKDNISPELAELLNMSVASNSTAFEQIDKDTGKLSFIGSKTESALLEMCLEQGWTTAKELRDANPPTFIFPFSSMQKSSGAVIRLPNGKYRFLIKGASEIVLRMASQYVVTTAQTGLKVEDLDAEVKHSVEETIVFYAKQSLRTIGIAYKDLPEWPPANWAPANEEEQEAGPPFALLAKDLTFIAVTAIEDPLRGGVIEAVANCNRAGVQVKMCTGDNVITATSIAKQCGIFIPNSVVIEGPTFRKLTEAQRFELAPSISIMARSSPEDKRILVDTLMKLGNVVAVTGDGANDAPALKRSNVGFAMGIAGTEVAKEASDIVIMDDSFASIVKAIIWGRCVNDSVKKFLQFQLSVNVTAVIITFFTAVISDSEESVLSAVQLLWVNLIMDTFAALALATDPATESSLDRKPESKYAPLLTAEMIKMILIQALYQIVICFILHYAGLSIIGLESNNETRAELKALVFNVFVFAQIFNMINNRRLDRKFNIFEGFLKNYWFMGIFAVMVGGQILIVEFGGAAFQVVRLGGRDWGISLVAGFLSIPLGAIARMLPTRPLERALIKLRLYPDPDNLPLFSQEAEDEAAQFEYNQALTKAKEDLSLFTTIRSGSRVRLNPLVKRSRARRMRKANLRYPELLTMAPSLLLGAVAAGSRWVYPLASNDDRQARGDGTVNPTTPWQGSLTFHPATDHHSPLYAKYGQR
ncbi:hypothetical protein QFC21_005147 [Naganishia friedmannii]|uniref:Uncharacterized protein n=1 Tax=Naganishia friedmannii TaxID=89922 RepID=A0ACC2VBJ2_9TREE|nr:hypothetical protein QFC21_005147 [Naganishia friedmannii]